MPDWILDIVIALAISIATIWLILAVALLVMRPDKSALKDVARLPVDVVRLVRALLQRGDLPRGARVRLWLLLGYLLVPIDIVPDFIPVLGYADDVVVIAVLLRGAVRAIGEAAAFEAWPGTATGFDALGKVCGWQPVITSRPADDQSA